MKYGGRQEKSVFQRLVHPVSCDSQRATCPLLAPTQTLVDKRRIKINSRVCHTAARSQPACLPLPTTGNQLVPVEVQTDIEHLVSCLFLCVVVRCRAVLSFFLPFTCALVHSSLRLISSLHFFLPFLLLDFLQPWLSTVARPVGSTSSFLRSIAIFWRSSELSEPLLF